MECRILEKGKCEITQGYSDNHKAVDIVGSGYTLDYVVAHSKGKITFFQDGLNNIKGSSGNTSYGNCVKIDHGNGFETLYAHMQKGLLVNEGQVVDKGQRLGYMSNSGNAYGAHTHFEVRKNNERINPIDYLNDDIIKEPTKSVSEVADEVLNGDWGNQPERQQRLEAAGYNYEEVRAEVNRKYYNKNNDEIHVGDKVQIISTGNGNTKGTANVAYGVGWIREVLKIYDGNPFPYQIGNNTGTTGFYSKSALKKI